MPRLWPPSSLLITSIILFLLVFNYSYIVYPSGGYDWRRDIGPAARHPWPAPWDSPGEGYGLPLPPWTAVILAPLGFLADRLATAMTNALAVLAAALLAQRFKAPWWTIVLPFITWPALWYFQNGQTEWLMLFGYLLPYGWDLPLLILKPQVMAWVALVRLKKRGWRYLVPLAGICLLSIVVWGNWPLLIYNRYTTVLMAGSWDMSVWPWGIPLGLWLLWQAWKQEEDIPAALASPFLFPYVNGSSYLVLLILLFVRYPRRWFTWAVWIFACFPLVLLLVL